MPVNSVLVSPKHFSECEVGLWLDEACQLGTPRLRQRRAESDRDAKVQSRLEARCHDVISRAYGRKVPSLRQHRWQSPQTSTRTSRSKPMPLLRGRVSPAPLTLSEHASEKASQVRVWRRPIPPSQFVQGGTQADHTLRAVLQQLEGVVDVLRTDGSARPSPELTGHRKSSLGSLDSRPRFSSATSDPRSARPESSASEGNRSRVLSPVTVQETESRPESSGSSAERFRPRRFSQRNG
mmetsp:Transcript_37726/g.82592  ORF Transcript_37726/g.82592 Transcript_37726/m.82592 type:complete len:238 (+) Transcript_37726:7-720(+)